jgi:hypothetical protein
VGETPTCGHEARQEETTMMAFEAMDQERLAFLSELYTRSAGDARQGIPYEALIDALGFGELVTKRIQCELEREGVVELTAVPRMTTVGRTVGPRTPAASSADDRHNTPRDAAHGGHLRELSHISVEVPL